MRRLAAVAVLSLAFSAAAFANEESGHHEPPVIYKWINFGILAAGLGWVAMKSGKPFFEERAQGIAVALDAASRVKAEAEAEVASISKRISNLDSELAAMKTATREEMDKERERAARDTEALLEKMRANAAQEIQSAAKHAEFELRRLSSQLALQLAEQKIRARMSGQIQAGLVRGFTASLRDQAQFEQRG